MRVYLPLTVSGLAALRKAGEAGPAPLTAYAVTPALREWYVSGDQEELEYAALGRAALASLRLVAADPAAPRRRVVVAADVPETEVEADPGRLDGAGRPGEVRLTAAVPLRLIASVHMDDGDAEADVTAAAGAVAAADAGDTDAAFTVDGAADHELLWYAVQEIDHIL
ncbi:hypothetical protein [Streptomyces sp. RFCAC02]|uniref:DUF6912 family protein n=1 Tax=Streptomyces sp. RFCAC02 TaxID=2499143 RepID=UPI0010208E34|nr:hypothetical protein [Streptomyces sp. RFCAC02]